MPEWAVGGSGVPGSGSMDWTSFANNLAGLAAASYIATLQSDRGVAPTTPTVIPAQQQQQFGISPSMILLILLGIGAIVLIKR